MPYSEFVEVMGHEPELVTPFELKDIYLKHPVHVEPPSKEEIMKTIRFAGDAVVADFRLKGTGGAAIYLRMHLMLEAYLAISKPDAVEWPQDNLYNLDYEILMIQKWVHPYVWYDPTHIDGVISDGRIACEMYIPARRLDVFPYINYYEECRLLSFADNVPEFVDPEVRHKKGTHDWRWLSGNYGDLIAKALNGEEVYDDDFDSIVWYDGFILRKRLERIAEKRSGSRAAELLRMFQKEWKDVKRWKLFFDTMDEENLEEFEDMLMSGMDDLLEEWETEDVEPEEVPATPVRTKKEAKAFEPDFVTFTKLNTYDYNIVAMSQALLKVMWIDEGNPDDFMSLFSGKISQSQVVWTGKVGKDNLYLLFDMMVKGSFIKVPQGHSMQRIVESHFVDKNGEYVTGINSGKPSKKAMVIIEQIRQILAARQTFDE